MLFLKGNQYGLIGVSSINNANYFYKHNEINEFLDRKTRTTIIERPKSERTKNTFYPNISNGK